MERQLLWLLAFLLLIVIGIQVLNMQKRDVRRHDSTVQSTKH